MVLCTAQLFIALRNLRSLHLRYFTFSSFPIITTTPSCLMLTLAIRDRLNAFCKNFSCLTPNGASFVILSQRFRYFEIRNTLSLCSRALDFASIEDAGLFKNCVIKHILILISKKSLIDILVTGRISITDQIYFPFRHFLIRSRKIIKVYQRSIQKVS